VTTTGEESRKHQPQDANMTLRARLDVSIP
jgi:hypothetical protein